MLALGRWFFLSLLLARWFAISRHSAAVCDSILPVSGLYFLMSFGGGFFDAVAIGPIPWSRPAALKDASNPVPASATSELDTARLLLVLLDGRLELGAAPVGLLLVRGRGVS